MAWQKVTYSQTPTWNPEEQNEVEGVLKQVKTQVGPNESNLYILQREDGDIGVWGSTALDGRMSEVKLGDTVKIVYLGKEKSEKTGRIYKAFEVYIDQREDIPVIEP